MHDNDITFYTFLKFKDNLNDFIKNYDIENIIVPPDSARRKFLDRKDRICRYCGRSAKDTTFKKEAHIIPQLMGNRYLVSDFECDKCNELFSKYENHLTEFLGITRTVFGTLGKAGKPKYKSQGDALSARPIHLSDNNSGVVISDNSREGFKIDDETGKTEISYTKNKYIPILVYKSLLKIALGLLEEKDIPKYKFPLWHLVNSTNDVDFSQIAKIHEYNFSRSTKVHCILFRKRSQDLMLPTHIFQLYYENMMYEFFIPANSDDSAIYDGRKFEITWCPPLLLHPPDDGEYCHSRQRDLSGLKKIEEEGVISMEFLPGTMKTLSRYNPATGEFKEDPDLDPKSIAKILLVPLSSELDFKKVLKDGLPSGY